MVKQYSDTITVNRLISGSDVSNPCGRPVVNLADGNGSKLDTKKEFSQIVWLPHNCPIV